MYGICIAACLLPALLLLTILVIFMFTDERRRKHRKGLGALLAVLSVATAGTFALLNILPASEFGPFSLPTFREQGSRPASYFDMRIAPAENGSVYVVYTSNAGLAYSSSDIDCPRFINYTLVDGNGRIVPRAWRHPALPEGPGLLVNDARYQDGCLFVHKYEYCGSDHVGVYTRDESYPSNLSRTDWQGNAIYHLPGGPLVVPEINGDQRAMFFNNGLVSSTGKIFLVNGSRPFYCSVIDENGTVVVNRTTLELGPVPHCGQFRGCLALNGQDQLVMLYYSYTWSRSTGTSTEEAAGLNIYNANLSLAMSVQFDMQNEAFRGRLPQGFWRVDDHHYRVLYSKREFDPSALAASMWRYNDTLGLMELTLNDTGVEEFHCVDMARLYAVHLDDCAFARDGQSIFIAYERDELYLKALTLSGQEKYAEVRLTPTDDEVYWDYSWD